MILDDFVMLGTTVPEPSSDGRVFVCSAGVSAERRSLVRIYPLARRNIPHRWHRYRVSVEVNPKDSRPESYKVTGDRAPGVHETINDQFSPIGKVPDREWAALLRPYVIGSIAEANRKRMSLAIIHPESLELRFEHNPSSPESPQLTLFDMDDAAPAPKAGAKRFPFIPRLRFRDELGWHDLMLRDWGCYEFMRKHPQAYYQQNLAGALHLKPSSTLLVGNLNHHRNSWLAISLVNNVREQPTLFDALPSERPTISEKVRRQVYDRDNWSCVACGSGDDLTVDHKLAYSRGGSNALDNLQTLCRSCNSRKADGEVA